MLGKHIPLRYISPVFTIFTLRKDLIKSPKLPLNSLRRPGRPWTCGLFLWSPL